MQSNSRNKGGGRKTGPVLPCQAPSSSQAQAAKPQLRSRACPTILLRSWTQPTARAQSPIWTPPAPASSLASTRRLLPPDPAPTPQPPLLPQILHGSGPVRTRTTGGRRSILWLPQGPGKLKQRGKERLWPGQDTGASIIKERYPRLTLLNASLCSEVLPRTPRQRSIAGTWPVERPLLRRGRREHGAEGPLCMPATAPRWTPLPRC